MSTDSAVAAQPLTTTLLLVGPSAIRHEPQPDEPRDILAVSLPASAVPDANTVVVPVNGSPTGYYRITGHGRRSAVSVAPVESILRDQAGGDLAPLFLLVAIPDGHWQPFAQVSFTGAEMVFVRLPGAPVTGSEMREANVRAWVDDLGERHRAHAPQLNNHQRWWINARPDLEIEQKFTLEGRPDIWRLAVEARTLIGAGDLTGWVLEPSGGFEQWDFLNHLYEITEPADERGYVAFIPAVNGTWITRRKWGGDQIVRREVLNEGITLPDNPDLETVVKGMFGVESAWNATYRRVRYNVLMESLRTGHVFSVMFDRCTVPGADIDPLFQVEVEYVRSRTLLRRPPEEDGLMEDFRALTDWTRQWLTGSHIGYVEHDLSKLTWLREAVGPGRPATA